jgi:hypothetical protein
MPWTPWLRAAAVAGAAAVVLGPTVRAADEVSGLITRTYTIVEDTELTGDVVCEVATGTPCFAFGAPGVELRLNGYTISGRADATTGCTGAGPAGEHGVSTGGQRNVSVRGPGVVQRFRAHGVAVLASTDARVEGLTSSTNCGSGVFIQATSFGTLVEGVTAVRNGSTAPGASCGGI